MNPQFTLFEIVFCIFQSERCWYMNYIFRNSWFSCIWLICILIYDIYYIYDVYYCAVVPIYRCPSPFIHSYTLSTQATPHHPILSSCLGWYHPFSAILDQDALAWESAGCCLVARESLQTSSCPLNPISPSPTASAWINHVYSAFFDLHCHYAQDPLFFCGLRSSAHFAGIIRSPFCSSHRLLFLLGDNSPPTLPPLHRGTWLLLPSVSAWQLLECWFI